MIEQFQNMVDNINKLPTEVLVVIFKELTLYEVVINCMQTCQRWKSIIAAFILPDQLCTFANLDSGLKRDLRKDGWHKDCEDNELLLHLWTKYSARMLKGTIYFDIRPLGTVWTFHDFPITQILREINFGES